VARRTALKARSQRARRLQRERQAGEEEPAAPAPLPDDLGAVLDEELARLEERYRQPVVLCYLQGKTCKEAARCLGWPLGTVAGRRARALALLRERLARRGVVPSAALLTAALARDAAALPAPLIQSTVTAATLPRAGRAAALAHGVLRTMLLTKLKTVLALVAVALLVGGGLLAHWALSASGDRAEPAPGGWKERATYPDGKLAAVREVALSPDGKFLAGALADNTIKVWDLAAGKVRAALEKAGSGNVGPLTFSADGTMLAAGKGSEAVVWNVEGGKVKARIRPPTAPGVRGAAGIVEAVAFAPDGKTLAVASDGKAHFADLTGGAKVLPGAGGKGLASIVHGGPASCRALAFRHDGKTLAVAGFVPERFRGGDRVRNVVFVDVATRKPQARPFPHNEAGLFCVALSPNGNWMARGGRTRVVYLWAFPGGEGDIFVLEGHKADVRAVAFTADGKHLATAGDDGAVLVWEVETGKRVASLKLPGRKVRALVFADGGATLVAAAADGTVRVWRRAVRGRDRE
jgi:WD40 repeat protein